MLKLPGFSTRCVHNSQFSTADNVGSPPHLPIYNSTTFAYPTTADLMDVLEGRRQGPLYTRYGFNPTIFALEEKLATLELAEMALAFNSGMAAEAAVLLCHGKEGIICLGDAYGGTIELIGSQLPILGIPTYLLLSNELDQVEQRLAQGAKLLFVETPTNPTLEVFDIAALAALAHRYQALLVVDNTFASPVNQQPLTLGADIVVHSATKYLGGHSDLTAGALLGSRALLEPVWNWRKNLGTVPAPETAALLARSLATLPVRVARQNQSALAIAWAMASHPKVARVLYPGLPDHPGYDIARRQMNGFGGMVTLELIGDLTSTIGVVDKLKLFAIAPSLGGVESLVTQPVTTTHHGIEPKERQRRGISDAMVRLSVGLEDVNDLLADLEQALH
mgnify:CR=1 FL=1